MKKELALELKAAGWKKDIVVGFEGANEQIIAPSLSELIEACGPYKTLYFSPNGEKVEFHFDGQGVCKTVFGDTIEEAVANLWLALQDK